MYSEQATAISFAQGLFSLISVPQLEGKFSAVISSNVKIERHIDSVISDDHVEQSTQQKHMRLSQIDWW